MCCSLPAYPAYQISWNSNWIYNGTAFAVRKATPVRKFHCHRHCCNTGRYYAAEICNTRTHYYLEYSPSRVQFVPQARISSWLVYPFQYKYYRDILHYVPKYVISSDTLFSEHPTELSTFQCNGDTMHRYGNILSRLSNYLLQMWHRKCIAPLLGVVGAFCLF